MGQLSMPQANCNITNSLPGHLGYNIAMCGRYTFYDSSQLAQKYELSPKIINQLAMPLEVNYNVAPGHYMPVIVRGGQENTVAMMKWGLIPSWAKEPSIGYKLINARQETLLEKSTWKRLVGSRRCLVPANGFYEWQKSADAKTKQPYYIHLPNQPLFSFAGLWDSWHDASGARVDTFTIITTEPNAEMAPIHDRMPVILDHAAEALWLGPGQLEPELLHDLLKPYPNGKLEVYKVADKVNKPGHVHAADLIYPLPDNT